MAGKDEQGKMFDISNRSKGLPDAPKFPIFHPLTRTLLIPTVMVHPCLEIGEIVQQICSHVCYDRIIGLDYFRNLASLAKVNKAFRSWAMPLLWIDLESHIPLLLSFPLDLWEVEYVGRKPILSLARLPMLDEMEDFLKRSHRVRLLTLPFRGPERNIVYGQLPSPESISVAPETFTRLGDFAEFMFQETLFPNLISFTAFEASAELEPLLHLLPQNLSVMQLPVAHYDPRFRRGANCAQIVKHIAAHNQSLSTLFILGMPPSRADKLVCALPQLRHLTATRLKATGLQHLAGLSTLESLHLYFTEELSLDLLDETSFLSLRSLTAYCSGLIISIKLVHKLAHSPLTRMRIMVNMKPIQKTQRHPEGNFEKRKGLWIELFKVIGVELQHWQMRSLEIAEVNVYPHGGTVLSFKDALKPLLAFTELRKLEILTKDGIIMDQEDYELLQHCMPSLDLLKVRLVVPDDRE